MSLPEERARDSGSTTLITHEEPIFVLISMRRCAAQAWASDKITVNALAPAVQTPGADRLREFLGPDAGALIDQQLQTRIPLGGALGDPARDLAPVLVFLAGTGSGFITGQLIAVDGGLIMVGG